MNFKFKDEWFGLVNFIATVIDKRPNRIRLLYLTPLFVTRGCCTTIMTSFLYDSLRKFDTLFS